ncbi:hypothetical protein ACFQ4O_03900 [Methylopila musalis]|uniref:Uncharacterized protein n=1 Tax=Methylopila musalis TaxID=1134781 RepID=A0ABW3Z4L2_9HYPH
MLKALHSRSPRKTVELFDPDRAPFVANAPAGKLDILVELLDAVDASHQ